MTTTIETTEPSPAPRVLAIKYAAGDDSCVCGPDNDNCRERTLADAFMAGWNARTGDAQPDAEMPPAAVVGALVEAAGPDSDVVRGAAFAAGLMWPCPTCEWPNSSAFATCDNCGQTRAGQARKRLDCPPARSASTPHATEPHTSTDH
jgi:hypothetical protein